MDVRCERCRAQYVFDDEQITPSGLTVQCTNCGHLFRVKKKELVVTVAVKPGELDQAPVPASVAAQRRPGGGAGAPEPDVGAGLDWRLRLTSGEILTVRELSTLQRWIVERRVGRDDEVAGGPVGDDGWRRLGSLPDLAPFFQVVDAADRGRPGTEPLFPAVQPPSRGAPIPPPPSGFPPPSFTQPRPAPPPQPTLVFPAPPDEPEVTADTPLPPAARERPMWGRVLRLLLSLVLVAVAAAAAVYVFAPGLLERPVPPPVPPAALEDRPVALAQPEPTAAAPVAPMAAAPAPPEPEPAAPAPVPAPEAAAAAASGAPATPTDPAPPPPTPAATTPPAAVAPKTPKAQLADADRLRARGDCKRALDLYGRLVARDPEHAAALTGRGLCYLDAEDYGPAEASFQAALAVEPASADALLGLAETLRWQGRTAEAITYYEKYLAKHPDGEDAPVARNALDTLRR